MSGTSLDGIDLAEVFLTWENEQWIYEFGACETLEYPEEWRAKLQTAIVLSKDRLEELDKQYTTYLALQINDFIRTRGLSDLDAICSHGHTVFHKPEEGLTLQIGNRPELAQLLQQTVVCDFRVQDVQLGGQGAPLVPIGDRLLFGNYDACVNLGGFANISFELQGDRMAFDLCPVNSVLNPLANQLGKPYDENGYLAKNGQLNQDLLNALNSLEYYKQHPPKSLGLEWVKEKVDPILGNFRIKPEDLLRTFTEHAAQQIVACLEENSKVMFTGGGAFNGFLMQQIQKQKAFDLEIPERQLIEYKEALIFALLGVLKLRNEVNCLSSVTGASKDHSSGNIFNA